MTKPGVYFIVDLAIAESQLDAFQAIAEEMVQVTKQESGALGYEFYLDPDQGQCRLIEVYADSDAVVAHVKGRAVQELVPKLLELSTMTGFSVYGDLSPEAANMLTQVGAKLFKTWRGFNRF